MSAFLDFVSRPEILLVGLGAIIFLTLYWVLRGSPVGQAAAAEPSEAPRPGYRDRVVAFAIAGFLIVLLGAYVAVNFGILWSLLPFAIGFGSIFGIVAKISKYRHVSPTLRRTGEFSISALSLTLLGGILIIANIFAFRYGGRPLDFTQEKHYTLADLTIGQIKQLDAPLKFTVISAVQSATANASLQQLSRLLDLYKNLNPSRISVRQIDAYDPAQASDLQQLRTRNPDLNILRGGALLIEYGPAEAEQHRILQIASMFTTGSTASTGLERTFRGEDEITTAIQNLRNGKRIRIAFTTGHGEPSLASGPQAENGLGVLKTRLASHGTDALPINLLEQGIPEEIETLVIVNPTSRFQDTEVNRIKQFLAKKHGLLVMKRAALDSSLDDGLTPILDLHNIAFGPGTIVDPKFNTGRSPLDVVTPPIELKGHPIIESMNQQSFLVPSSSPMRILGAGPVNPNYKGPAPNPSMVVFDLLKTGETSWSERSNATIAFDQGIDLPGPLTVGLAASERGGEIEKGKVRPAVVVLSSPGFASDSTLQRSPANLDLVINSLFWLRGKTESAGVSARTQKAFLFTADPNLRARLHLVPTVLSLVLIVGFGLTTFLARRS
jgi:hypothetical protein